MIIGSHVSFLSSSGLLGSVKEALSYGANTFMIYTSDPHSSRRSAINDMDTYEGLKLMMENSINPNNVIVHAPYIVNLANISDKEKHEFYINYIIEELERVDALGLNKIVLHPGSAVKCSKEEAIYNITSALNIVLKSTKNVTILLEYMAGKGNEVGTSIDELKSMIDKIDDKSRIGVCLDTCHMNDSGIDLNHFDNFLNEFDEKIGIDKIKCIHINDSMNIIGAHKDRHDNIGYGTIGFDTLLNVIYNTRVDKLPFILETPYVNRNEKNSYAPYKYEIENIRNKKFTSFK